MTTKPTKPSESILAPLRLTLDGGWELGDIQRVLIALLQRLDAPPAATGKPSGSILGPLNLTLDGTWDSGAPARVLRAMLRERDEQCASGRDPGVCRAYGCSNALAAPYPPMCPVHWSASERAYVQEQRDLAAVQGEPIRVGDFVEYKGHVYLVRQTGEDKRRPMLFVTALDDKPDVRSIWLFPQELTKCPPPVSRVEGERCQKCGAFAVCVDAGLGGSDNERWCVDCAMRSVCATVSRVEGAAEARPSAWKQCVTCGACYPASSVCSNCVPVAEPPSPVEPKRCERRCTCAICMPYWPRATAEVAATALSRLATVEADNKIHRMVLDDIATAAKAPTFSIEQLPAVVDELRQQRDVAREHTRTALDAKGAAESARDDAESRADRLEAERDALLKYYGPAPKQAGEPPSPVAQKCAGCGYPDGKHRFGCVGEYKEPQSGMAGYWRARAKQFESQLATVEKELQSRRDADGIWQSQMETVQSKLESALAEANARAERLEAELKRWQGSEVTGMGQSASSAKQAGEPVAGEIECRRCGLVAAAHRGCGSYCAPLKPPATPEPVPCSECGGNGTGPDRCDGPGDVYQDKCGRCNGSGLEPVSETKGEA